MRVGFYTAFRRDPIHYVLAGEMVKSVRHSMPGVSITQLTDETSPPVYGIDAVRRLPTEHLCVATARHYSECEGDWLLIDTDVLVLKDVRHVFEGATWDVALTDRIGTTVTGEVLNPWCGDFNIGVVFQRNGRAFWAAVLEGLLAGEEKYQKWMGNQVVASRILKEREWNVAYLPGREFNYPPKTQRDELAHASIAHYKGKDRKKWLWEKATGICTFA